MSKKKPAPPGPKAKPAASTVSAVSPDHSLVRDLATILRETELTEIEVERNGLRIRVARQLHGAPSYAVSTMVAAPAASAPVHAPTPATPAERAQHPGAVKSPMVGTAYHAPSPGAAPFVRVGDQVKEGQTLLIIEAMKTMNQIPSPRAGKIVEITVRDAHPVEFGEVMMIIE